MHHHALKLFPSVCLLPRAILSPQPMPSIVQDISGQPLPEPDGTRGWLTAAYNYWVQKVSHPDDDDDVKAKNLLTFLLGISCAGLCLAWVTIYFHIGCTWAAVVCLVGTLIMFYGGIHVLLTKKNDTGLTCITFGLVFGTLALEVLFGGGSGGAGIISCGLIAPFICVVLANKVRLGTFYLLLLTMSSFVLTIVQLTVPQFAALYELPKEWHAVFAWMNTNTPGFVAFVTVLLAVHHLEKSKRRLRERQVYVERLNQKMGKQQKKLELEQRLARSLISNVFPTSVTGTLIELFERCAENDEDDQQAPPMLPPPPKPRSLSKLPASKAEAVCVDLPGAARYEPTLAESAAAQYRPSLGSHSDLTRVSSVCSSDRHSSLAQERDEVLVLQIPACPTYDLEAFDDSRPAAPQQQDEQAPPMLPPPPKPRSSSKLPTPRPSRWLLTARKEEAVCGDLPGQYELTLPESADAHHQPSLGSHSDLALLSSVGWSDRHSSLAPERDEASPSNNDPEDFDDSRPAAPQPAAASFTDGIIEQFMEKLAPRSLSRAVVLFSDIVGFTTAASKTNATTLVYFLDKLFGEIDEVCQQQGVDKIKTIGDAYMCVGWTADAASHASTALRVLEVANAMHRIIHRLHLDRKKMSKRVGIHTGTVVSGIIGKTKFAFDIWGDAVNVASRMESTGVPGATQVSAEFYEVVKGHVDYILPRGFIDVKGKGKVQTYVTPEFNSGDGALFAEDKAPRTPQGCNVVGVLAGLVRGSLTTSGKHRAEGGAR